MAAVVLEVIQVNEELMAQMAPRERQAHTVTAARMLVQLRMDIGWVQPEVMEPRVPMETVAAVVVAVVVKAARPVTTDRVMAVTAEVAAAVVAPPVVAAEPVAARLALLC